MDLGFSSLGDPSLSFEASCKLAYEYGLAFVELRVMEGSLDLPGYFAERPFPSRPLRPIRVLGSSLRLIGSQKSEVDEFLRFAKLATALGVPYVRAFGGGEWGKTPTEREIHSAQAVAENCREQIALHHLDCELLLETHGSFSDSEACLRLNQRLAEPLAILWDSHHTWRVAGESPDETWVRLGTQVRHIHYKDSVSDIQNREGCRYVLPGLGEYPTEALIQLLQNADYQGGVSLEWEKLWHSDLPPLHVALKAFCNLLPSRLMSTSGN